MHSWAVSSVEDFFCALRRISSVLKFIHLWSSLELGEGGGQTCHSPISPLKLRHTIHPLPARPYILKREPLAIHQRYRSFDGTRIDQDTRVSTACHTMALEIVILEVIGTGVVFLEASDHSDCERGAAA